MRRAAKRDESEAAIVSALRGRGHRVLQLDDFDLLVCHRITRQLTMLEVKSRGGVLTDSQRDLIAEGWPLKVIRTPEQALEAVGS